MSSLLNVPNARNRSEEFSLKDIEVLVSKKEQNWFERIPGDSSYHNIDCQVIRRGYKISYFPEG